MTAPIVAGLLRHLMAAASAAVVLLCCESGAAPTRIVRPIELPPAPTVADIRVSPMTLDVGQHVPLAVTVLSSSGNIMTGVSAAYQISSPDVAIISPTGVVSGVSFGTTSVTVIVDTVRRSVPVRVKAWPQEPDGFSRVTERDFSHLAASAADTSGLDGWDASEESKWPNFSVAEDLSAPHSPPTVLQAAYAAGTAGGTPAATPGRMTHTIATASSVYLSVWVQLSANWYAHETGTNKILYIWINGQPRFFLSAEGSNAAALSPSGRLQGTPDDIERGREILWPNVAASRAIPGVWQRWEVLLKSNTPGFRDGEFHLWIDGIETARYTDVAYLGIKDTQPFTLVDIEPIWGGGGDRLPAAQTMRIDHIYVSRKE